MVAFFHLVIVTITNQFGLGFFSVNLGASSPFAVLVNHKHDTCFSSLLFCTVPWQTQECSSSFIEQLVTPGPFLFHCACSRQGKAAGKWKIFMK